MKKRLLCSTLALMGLFSAANLRAGAATPPPATLTLADLANRPDRWPPTVTAQREFDFVNGAVVHQGDKLSVVAFDGSVVGLNYQGKIPFRAVPNDVGFVDAANQWWATLTPAQRAIDPASLASDITLWPPTVTLTNPVKCSFGNLPAGTEVGLIEVTPTDIDIAWPNSPNRLRILAGMTDVISRARALALVDPAKRPSRIAAALENVLVDSTGQPYHDDHLADKKYFALYFGGNWCPACHLFSPDFSQFLAQQLPAHPELMAVLISNDNDVNQTLAYAKAANLPIPVMSEATLDHVQLIVKYQVKIIPHLVLVDRFGNVLANNGDAAAERADLKDTLAQITAILNAPATQP
jgi:thiol-disulfide isomerase/thioredoxin